ncbi:acyl-CoA thioesterase [Natronolimnobius baerhuensis]|uniref:Thioesterase n=1 Tax=Natronolimnobius baerhuensis TaxID=253108 RepID=A0A202ED36_9EURY|nr:thioesterase family protein [Natronolimnobius baerhuensis]OVE86142.1 thioesterase [Natronolimnobius baerhuensis]
MSEKFTVEMPVRFRDLDPLNHVNNAVYVSYLESARVAYVEEVFESSLSDISFVVANLEISYERPITMDDDPVIVLWTTDLGTSSCTMAYEIRVDGDVAATAETVMVCTDLETGRPTPIPDSVRERVQAYDDLE